MTVGNISLSDFLRSDSIYDKLYFFIKEPLLTTDSKYRAVILKDDYVCR